MGPIVAIMNAKGGVGKSTTSVMLCDALSTECSAPKRVLLVDADPQGNSSLMLLGPGALQRAQDKKRTLAGMIERLTSDPDSVAIDDYLVKQASDLKKPRTLHVLPGSVELAWVERDTRDVGRQTPVVRAAMMLRQLREHYEYIIIDCPPSISLFTECWLRHADLHLSPSKPELLSQAGLRLVWELKDRESESGRPFAHQLGTVITMWRDQRGDNDWVGELRKNKYFDCFQTVIPLSVDFQRVAEFDPHGRAFGDKYGKRNNKIVKDLAEEFIQRCKNKPLRPWNDEYISVDGATGIHGALS